MSDNNDDRRLNDLNDDELDEIEQELLRAAEAHRIDLNLEVETTWHDDSKVRETMDEASEARIEELNRRADALIDEADMTKIPETRSAPKSPEQRELDARFDRIESVAARARKTEHTRLAKESTKKDSEQNAAIGLGVGMSFMFAMVGMLIVGLGVGYLIDNANGTTVWKGYGAVIGATLGMVFGLYQINRFQNRL